MSIQMISASAGSGKTHRLTGELTDLLGTYKPSEIIATTFTRAAAGELKSRVRKSILESEHKNRFHIASIIDQALIGTVNGIGGQLLSYYAFEKGISPALSVIEDEEKAVILQMALSSILGEAELAGIEEIEERLSLKKDDLRKQVEQLIDTARTNNIGAEKFPGFKKESVDAFNESLPETQIRYNDLVNELIDLIPQLEQEAVTIGDNTATTKIYLKEIGLLHYQLQNSFTIPWQKWSSLQNKRPSVALAGTAAFAEVAQRLESHMHTGLFHNDLNTYISYCFDVAQKTLCAYQQIKSERGLIDFVDQEAGLLELLDQPEVQSNFKEQFKVLLVDEFQDTSPLQLALFLKMAFLVEKVIWVGDPKQAIYGFRTSDSQLINQVMQQVDAGSHLTKEQKLRNILQESWRSRPHLVEAVNHIFLPLFTKDGALVKEQVVLHPQRKERDQFQAALQLWGFQWRSPGNRVLDNNQKYLSQVATRLKTFKGNDPKIEDKDSKQLRSINWGDIAILCRTNNKCRNMANALREQGIQAVVANTGLNLTAEWRLLKACLNLLMNEQDSLAKAEIAFLTTAGHDMAAIIDDRLAAIHNDIKETWKNDDPSIGWINNNRMRLLDQPLPVIIPLIYAGLSFQRLVQQWGDGAQRTNNLDQALLYAKRYEDHCAKFSLLPNPHGFLYWFEELADDNKDERGLTAHAQAVNVLTYHKAKGLEWPVVLMLDLDETFDADIFAPRIEAGALDMHDPLKERKLRYFTWPYGTSPYGKKNPCKPFSELFAATAAMQIEEHRRNEENLRLLYVGFTRARDYLLLGFQPGQIVGGERKSKTCWLDGILTKAQQDHFMQVTFSAGSLETEENIKDFVPGIEVRKWITQYSAEADAPANETSKVKVYKAQEMLASVPYLVNPSTATNTGKLYEAVAYRYNPAVATLKTQVEDERNFGTCIHHIFCAWQPALTEAEGKKLMERLLCNYGCNDAVNIHELYPSIVSFYQWITSLQPVTIKKEIPVTQARDGQLVKGMIDMLVETTDTIYIIDYKTYNPKTVDDDALNKKAKSYASQLSHYREIVSKAFPAKDVTAGIYFVFSEVMVWLEEVEALRTH